MITQFVLCQEVSKGQSLGAPERRKLHFCESLLAPKSAPRAASAFRMLGHRQECNVGPRGRFCESLLAPKSAPRAASALRMLGHGQECDAWASSALQRVCKFQRARVSGRRNAGICVSAKVCWHRKARHGRHLRLGCSGTGRSAMLGLVGVSAKVCWHREARYGRHLRLGCSGSDRSETLRKSH